MSDNKMLLVDSCNNGGLFLSLNESTDKGLTKFRGKFQEAEAVNKNKRMYPHGVLDENVKKLYVFALNQSKEIFHFQDALVK